MANVSTSPQEERQPTAPQSPRDHFLDEVPEVVEIRMDVTKDAVMPRGAGCSWK